MKAAVYTRPDGGISIFFPADESKLDALMARAIPAEATNVRVIEHTEIPTDRSFRNAWKHDFSVDMPKARDIWRNKIRQVRQPKLTALDVDYQRADERNDVLEKQRITTLKQRLRDLPADPAIDAAQTPEELKAFWPSDLA